MEGNVEQVIKLACNKYMIRYVRRERIDMRVIDISIRKNYCNHNRIVLRVILLHSLTNFQKCCCYNFPYLLFNPIFFFHRLNSHWILDRRTLWIFLDIRGWDRFYKKIIYVYKLEEERLRVQIAKKSKWEMNEPYNFMV